MNTSDLSIIIPFFSPSGLMDRLRNTKFFLRWLNEYMKFTDCEIILCEQYKTKPMFNSSVVYPNVHYIKVQKDFNFINYGWLINYCARCATKKYLLFSDSDAITDFRLSLKYLDEYDAVLPYDRVHCMDAPKTINFMNNPSITSLNYMSEYEFMHVHWRAAIFGAYTFFMNKEKYFDIGGFDEIATGWGDHDSIVSLKVKTFLKYKIVHSMLYHMNHVVELDYGNKQEKLDIIKNNNDVLKKLQSMSKDELKVYIEQSKNEIGKL